MKIASMSLVGQILGLLVFLLICFAAGGLGAIATNPQIDGWYQTLQKPTWQPPNWVFGPVWTTLYLLMAIAAWNVWRVSGVRQARLPLSLFGVQLVLNVAWSWIFFHFHELGWAFFELAVLWIAILATTISFLRVSRISAALMLPYLGWVTFAGVLNFTIWQLNRTLP